MTEHVLVTGGAGFIGSHTCKALATHGLHPSVFDSLIGATGSELSRAIISACTKESTTASVLASIPHEAITDAATLAKSYYCKLGEAGPETWELLNGAAAPLLKQYGADIAAALGDNDSEFTFVVNALGQRFRRKLNGFARAATTNHSSMGGSLS